MAQRLDRLTQDEARLAVAQILDVVHGLLKNTTTVMKRKQNPTKLVARWVFRNIPCRRRGVGRLSQGCPRYVSQSTIK